MRIKSALYLLVTCIQFSFEVPLLTTYRLEATPEERVAFTSPGYENGRYPDHTEKYWELYAPHAKKIQVVFEDFDVEYHQNCIWDNVTLVRSRCQQFMASGVGDVVLCGPLHAYEFDSDQTTVCVMFSSDKIVARRGFKAHAFAIPDNVGNNTNISTTTSIPTTSSSSTSSVVTQGATTSATGNVDSTTNKSPKTSSKTETSQLSLPSSVSPSSSSSSSPTSIPSSSTTSSSATSSTTTSSSTTLPPHITFSSSKPTSSSSKTRITSSSSSLSVSSSKITRTLFSSIQQTKTTSSVSSTTKVSPTIASSSSQTPQSASSYSSFPQSPLQTSSTTQSALSSSSSSATIKSIATTTTASPMTSSLSKSSSFNASSMAISTSSPTLSESAAARLTTMTTVLDVIIGELAHSSVDIGDLHELVVRSPTNKTGRYPTNRHDVLTVFNEKKATVSIEFIDFDIEFHPDCIWDYLQLTVGNKAPYRLCGGSTPDSQTTKADTIKIVFHSDHIVSLRGFEMKLTKISYGTKETQIFNGSTVSTSTGKAGLDVSQGSPSATPVTEQPEYLTTKTTLSSSSPPSSLSSSTPSSPSTSSLSSTPSAPLSPSSVASTVPKAFSTSTKESQSVSSVHSSRKSITPTVFMTGLKSSTAVLSTKQSSVTKPSETSTHADNKLSSVSKETPTSTESMTFTSSLSADITTEKTMSTSTPSTTKTTKSSSSTSASLSSVSSTGSSTKSSTATTGSATEPSSVLDVVICEFPESSVDISDLYEIVVKSPTNGNGKYPLNTSGNLTISNHLHMDVDIEFPYFDIEYHPDCIWDYLMLKLGDEPSHRLCGNTQPHPLTTKANEIEIEFHSDHIATFTGFEMKLIKISPPTSKGSQSTMTITGQTSTGPTSSTTSVGGTTSGSADTTSSLKTTSTLAAILSTTYILPAGPTASSTPADTPFAMQGGQHLMTPEKQGTTKSTTIYQPPTTKHSNTVTTQTHKSTTTVNHINTDTVSTATKVKHSSKSSAFTSTSTPKAATTTITTSLSATDKPKTDASSTGLTSTPSGSEMEEEHIITTAGKEETTESTTTEQYSTSNSPGNQPISTRNSIKASQPSTSSNKPSKSSTSEIKQTTKTQHFTQNQETILSTIIKPSLAISSTASTTKSSASPTSSVPTGNAACSADTMPEEMNAEFGYITSPGFGNTDEYPPNSNCKWNIRAGEKEVMMIIFESFDVEESLGCKWDKLIFYKTSNDGETRKKLVTLCGKDIPSTLSANTSLEVEFKSDSAWQRTGFRFQYIKVESETGRTYSCPSGKIPCPSSGQCIPVEWWCDNSDDCDDRTDELYCRKCPDNQIRCGDGVCLDMSNRCDGIPQCPYATDERECVFISNDGVPEQPVQVNVQGSWSPLCHDDVVVSKGDDVCKAVNYRSVELLTKGNAHGFQSFSLATLESGRLQFKTSSMCPANEVVHLQCSHSECGYKGEHVRKKRIIGGSISGKGEWPWSVALRLGRSDNPVICGGSIIDNLWVVTAGHCVRDLVANPQILSIVAGVNDINDAERQIRYVSEVIVHPKYDYIFNADIALLRLQRPLHFDENTKPICLPWDLRQFSPWDLCYVNGFGVSDMKDYYTTVTPKFLRHVKTKIFDLEKCKAIYSSRFSSDKRIKDNMLCAGYTSGGMDACKGDSGGSLMCKGSDDRWLLAGVVSWGDMCGITNKPGVYTNVVSFMDWIANTTNPNGDRNVTCDFESNGWCGYTDVSEGSYVWTRKPGDKYVKGTILYAAKAPAAASNEPSRASLLTPTFSTSEDSCLSFSFMFSGNSNITLSVFGVDGSDEEQPVSDLLWRVTSHYPAKDSWLSTEVTVPDTYLRLNFVSLKENGDNSGLGLDNITMSKGQCVGSEFISCTFNEGNTCNYSQSSGPKSRPWTVVQEHTGTEAQEHQDQYIKAGGDFNTFGYHAVSQFISPELSNDFTSLPHCVTFSFNKVTETKNNLVLATYVKIGTQLINQKVLWTSDDDRLGQWVSTSTTIPHGVYDHIVFEVRRKDYTYEDIEVLLDDIKVTDGVCVQ